MLALVIAERSAAQPRGPCYFGECEPGAPPRQQTPAPVPNPAPIPQDPAPVPEPQRLPPQPPQGRPTVPAFFARNMCLRGNVAVPVNDAETCSRIYRDWGARRTDGTLVQCGILTRSQNGGYTFAVVSTDTVGQCFDMREELGSSRILGRCNLNFSAGYIHWRHDLTESECMSRTHPAIIIR